MRWHARVQEYVLRTRWLSVRRDHVVLPNGESIEDFYVVEKPDVVLVVALTERNAVILKEEYRYPVDDVLIELPGGLCTDPGETRLEAAQRELLEETGFTATIWEELADLYDYPSKDRVHISVFLASGTRRVGEPRPEATEQLIIREVDLEEAWEWVLAGKIRVSASALSISLARERTRRMALPGPGGKVENS